MITARNSPRQRSFQFRLRTLLALMAAVSVLMALCHHYLSNRRQWAAYEQVADKVQFSSTSPGRMGWLAPLAKHTSYGDFTTLSFRPSAEVNDDDMMHLVHMPRLKHLTLDRTTVTDRGLKRLEHLTELTALSLRNTSITDRGLARLHRLSNLKELCLRGTRVTPSGLAFLKNHPHLEHLDLAGLAIGDQDLIHLASLSKLEHLDLSGTQITGDGLKHLASLKQLEHLKVNSPRLRQVVLAEMPNLLMVDISGGRPLKMVSLRRMNALDTLSIQKPKDGSQNLEVVVTDAPRLREFGVGPASLRELRLSNAPWLFALDLGEWQVNRFNLDKLPHVKQLRLKGTVLSPSLIQLASHLPGLHSVELRNMRAAEGRSQVTAADLAFLRTATRLEAIDLSGTKLAPDALSVLRGHQQLIILDVARCGLTDSSLGELAHLPKLFRLDLRDNPINGTGLRHLVGLQNLERLHLNP